MEDSDKEEIKSENTFYHLWDSQLQKCKRITYIQSEMLKVSFHSFLVYYENRGLMKKIRPF